MQNDNDNLFKEHIAKLHPAVLEAIKESNWGEALHGIGKKFNLHVDEMGGLENETLFVMIGISEPEEFIGNIMKNVGFEQAKATDVAREINLHIFIPIREIIKKKLNRSESEQDEELDKNKILAEIENPAPRIPPQVSPAQIKPRPEAGKPTETKKPGAPAIPGAAAIPPPPPPPPSQAIYMEKLAGPVNYDPVKKEVTLPGKPILNLDREPKKYSIDPYREQAN